MKKYVLSLAIVSVLLFVTTNIQAQSWADLFKKENIEKVVNAVTGNNAIDMTGTWTYSGSAIEFESDNLLQKAGGAAAASLAENNGVNPYRILFCKPAEAMSEWRKWAAVAEERYDVVLFDLPGTVGNEGVLSTIVELDYLFIPMKADRIVLESTLNFASVLNDRQIKTRRAHLRELFQF